MKTRNKLLGLATLACMASVAFGIAVAPVSAQDGAQLVNETAKFEMQTGAQVRTADPAGIRFVTDVNAAYKEGLAKTYATDTYTYVWGTVLTCVDSDENTRTIDAVTEKWLDDESGWYTTLAGIPESDYLTEITAESYVKIYNDSELVYTDTVENAQTRSLAYSASWALNDGYNQDILKDYTAKIAGTSVELDKDGIAYVANGEEIQLTATAQPAEYGIAWRSSDTNVATVDKTGKVTAVGKGSATITASLGSASDSYQVAVDYTNIDFEDGKISPAIGSKLTALKDSDGTNYPAGTTYDLTVGDITANEQANKAYGTTGLESVANANIVIDYDWLKFAFSDETVTSITMDFYYKGGNPGWVRTGTGAATDETLAWSEVEYNSSSKVRRVRAVYARFNFALLPEGQDETIAIRRGDGLQCLYVDNVTTSTATVETLDLKETELLMGFSKTSTYTKLDDIRSNSIGLSNVDDIAATGNSAYGSNASSSMNTSTMYIYLSTEYMQNIFAQNDVNAITFDIILSVNAAKIQGPKNNDTDILNEASTSSTVETKTYYTYKVTITKTRFESVTTNGYMRLRYTGGGTSTFFYVDNLAIAK